MNQMFAFLSSPKPGAKTKETNPYDYDPIVLWSSLAELEKQANGTTYSDRLYQWDSRLHDDLCFKHFGNAGQDWSSRAPNSVQLFLRDYFKDKKIILTTITEYCNPSNGYPYWRFDYIGEKS